MNLFFLIFARDQNHVDRKIEELKHLNVPYLIVCGRKLNYPNVVYREPKGKYDAINFGFNFIPSNVDVVVLNDVDTKVFNIEAALREIGYSAVGLVYGRVLVREGPQRSFYVLLDSIRRKIPIAASGELMLVKRDILSKILPLKPCKAEDSYIMFKVIEFGSKVVFSDECYVETERTNADEKEELYKKRTVGGLYQALAYTHPPILVNLFYLFLPFASPLLLVFGKKGYYWMSGILRGFIDYLKGDKSGIWLPVK
ncbi:MAG: hypothetical protein QXZ70_02480 [Candidatus Bathyarchaeia archaeon]